MRGGVGHNAIQPTEGHPIREQWYIHKSLLL